MFYARSLLFSGFFIIVHVIAYFLALCSPYFCKCCKTWPGTAHAAWETVSQL